MNIFASVWFNSLLKMCLRALKRALKFEVLKMMYTN